MERTAIVTTRAGKQAREAVETDKGLYLRGKR